MLVNVKWGKRRLLAKNRMPYHIRVKPKSSRTEETRLDLTKDQLLDEFVIPYREGQPLFIGGRNILSDDIDQVRITWATEYSSDILPVVREDRARERRGRSLVTTISDEWHVANRGRDVTHEFIAGLPGSGLMPGHVIPDSEYLPNEIVMTSGEAIRIIGNIKSGYEDLRGTFNVNQVELADELEINEKLDKILDTQTKIIEYNRQEGLRIWWVVGGVCIIAGLSALSIGDYRLALEAIGFGLVLIAVGDEDLKKKLTNLFYSIFRGFFNNDSGS